MGWGDRGKSKHMWPQPTTQATKSASHAALRASARDQRGPSNFQRVQRAEKSSALALSVAWLMTNPALQRAEFAAFRVGANSSVPPPPRGLYKKRGGGRRGGPKILCTKRGPTRFSHRQISFFPLWSLWSGGGGGVKEGWWWYPPPPPPVYSHSNTSLPQTSAPQSAWLSGPNRDSASPGRMCSWSWWRKSLFP